jgi:hypothetical protein
MVLQRIINKHTDNYQLLDNYKFVLIQNVIHYELHNFDSYSISYEENHIDQEEVFFILDFTCSDSIFHWIAECSIYFDLFHQLRKQYPTIKMIFKIERSYHESIGKYFDIYPNDYLYHLPDKPNNCIFTLPISPLNETSINNDYILYSKYLIHTFSQKYFEKTNDILILPRQKKDNYKGNDRVCDCIDIIQNLQNAIVIHTDIMTDFSEQVRYLQTSKTIIVSDGSPFLLNGLIAKNSTVIVLGHMVLHQTTIYSKLKYYVDLIKEQNNVIFANSEKFEDIKDYI